MGALKDLEVTSIRSQQSCSGLVAKGQSPGVLWWFNPQPGQGHSCDRAKWSSQLSHLLNSRVCCGKNGDMRAMGFEQGITQCPVPHCNAFSCAVSLQQRPLVNWIFPALILSAIYFPCSSPKPQWHRCNFFSFPCIKSCISEVGDRWCAKGLRSQKETFYLEILFPWMDKVPA